MAFWATDEGPSITCTQSSRCQQAFNGDTVANPDTGINHDTGFPGTVKNEFSGLLLNARCRLKGLRVRRSRAPSRPPPGPAGKGGSTHALFLACLGPARPRPETAWGRQNPAESGQNRAERGRIGQNLAESGRIWQNWAESGSPGRDPASPRLLASPLLRQGFGGLRRTSRRTSRRTWQSASLHGGPRSALSGGAAMPLVTGGRNSAGLRGTT
jgi:hypothetical protein